jgi:alpha-beta hydrolase superfamily lysophospholipase
MFDIARLGLSPSWRGAMKFIFDAAAKTPLANVQLPGDFKVLNWLTGIANNRESGDEPNIRAEWNDAARRKYADLQIDRPTFGWVSSAYRTIEPSLKDSFLKAVKTPMLIGSAGQDNLVDNAAHSRVAKTAPAAEVLHLPTAHHSLWFENNGNYQSWTDRIDGFLDRIAPARQAAAPPAAIPAPRHELPLAA